MIEQNWAKRSGEIDLIVIDPPDTLVFVEVRYRRNTERGTGAESVTPDKIKKLTRTAQQYLVLHPEFRHTPCRIDVISMSNEIVWFKNAITLDS